MTAIDRPQMKSISVCNIIPFSWGLTLREDGMYQTRIIDELCSLSKKISFPIGDETFFPKIDVIKNKKEILKLNSQYQYNNIDTKYTTYVKFSFIFKEPIVNLELVKKNLGIGDDLAYKNHLIGYLSDGFTAFLLMLSVARPLGVSVDYGYTLINNVEFKRFGFFGSRFDGSRVEYLFDNINEYSHINDLDILDSWTWFINNIDLLYGTETTGISRALHAFMNTIDAYHKPNEALALLWTMIGIESIFTDDALHEESLTAQILSRSYLLFGDMISSKDIKIMYKIRSKFIHGKLSSSILVKNIEEEERIMERYEFQLCEATKTSFALLIASLQYAISRGWRDIKFHKSITVSS